MVELKLLQALYDSKSFMLQLLAMRAGLGIRHGECTS